MNESIKTPRRYVNDVEHLTEHYGNLEELRGTTLESSLKDFSGVCIRDSVKVANYIGLGRYLKRAYDIELKLYSQKSKV